MTSLAQEIGSFLTENGLSHSVENDRGCEVIVVDKPQLAIFPIEVKAATAEEAFVRSEEAWKRIKGYTDVHGYPVIITEDRWRSDTGALRKRLLAHMRKHVQVYARNCEVRRIEKKEAAAFLAEHHSYGNASCRYHYGMFLKRHTGHNADAGVGWPEPGTLVAVAQFSNARKWVKGEKEIRSYEWTRYASLSGVRISGGMGRMLKTFIEDVKPDDIMSYADLEWSWGEAYSQLGFTLEGQKDPVTFVVDGQWRRSPVKPGMTAKTEKAIAGVTGGKENVIAGSTGRKEAVIAGLTGEKENVIAGVTGNLFFRNFGSNKYRLKLTDYE